MKKRVVAVIMLFALMAALCGCADLKIPFLSKPEDAVDELMTQDSLIELLTNYEQSLAEDDDNENSAYLLRIITSPSLKKLFLDNVRTLSYSITGVTKKNDNTATVTVLITHHDIQPIADRAVQNLYDEVIKLFGADEDSIPADEQEQIDLFFSMLQKSIKEATAKTKPTETYTKVQFDCYRDSNMIWQVDEIPEDFSDKVLLMNFYDAFGDAFESMDYIY